MAEGKTSMTKSPWFVGLGVLAVLIAGAALAFATRPPPPPAAAEPTRAAGYAKKIRPHFDHTPVMPDKFESPQAVTVACLKCHPDAAHVMKSAHWLWLGDEVSVPGRDGAPVRMGKKNLLNNFCIATTGNEISCMKCHAGYGWVDQTFDFSKKENVDCLVCHEGTNTYVKGPGGIPTKGTDLLAAARSVGTPRRENCLGCHAYGGGGQAVKHGDLDSSLAHPFEEEDVHIGRHQFLCVDCHKAPGHQLKGKAFSVSVEDSNGVACTDCHVKPEHRDERLNKHLAAVACQTCHIPSYAGKLPTKATWDWSKAGDATRKEDPHSYLEIKGEFTYVQDGQPTYRWFNGQVGRYLAGDKIDPSKPTNLNPPFGGIGDKQARIWPYKVHLAKQPYDAGNNYLLAPITGGPGGYWTTFDWDSAFKLGEKSSGLAYSGKHGFAPTEMWWPLSHMVSPKEKALACTDCHGEKSRMDWTALGYAGDPIKTGGRP
jgi:octaheme c-type cytochrome (tetrathionate reductase family)